MPLAEDIMVKKDRVVTFHTHDDISYVAQTFYKKNISGAPVVDLEDRPIGVVSELDIIESVKKSRIEKLSQAKGLMEKTKVSEIMTKKVVTASPDASLTELADLMFKKDVNRIPIVDKNGKLLGLITRGDLLRGVYSQIEQR